MSLAESRSREDAWLAASRVLKALAHPLSLHIMATLQKCPMSVTLLAERLKCEVSMVSKRLAAMHSAGLVRSINVGRCRVYQVDPAVHAETVQTTVSRCSIRVTVPPAMQLRITYQQHHTQHPPLMVVTAATAGASLMKFAKKSI